jgi:ATP-dependent DNA helicase Q1
MMVPITGANTDGTVHFTAPLYRKNLHYKVVQKPSQGEAVYASIADWILQHHPNESGIVYCFSRRVCIISTTTFSDLMRGLAGL